MTTKEMGATHYGNTPDKKLDAKVVNNGVNTKDLFKVLEYFRYTTATTLMCFLATGILRNSLTWYVKFLEEAGMLRVAKKAADPFTGRVAKYYTADESKFPKVQCVQLDLFKED